MQSSTQDSTAQAVTNHSAIFSSISKKAGQFLPEEDREDLPQALTHLIYNQDKQSLCVGTYIHRTQRSAFSLCPLHLPGAHLSPGSQSNRLQLLRVLCSSSVKDVCQGRLQAAGHQVPQQGAAGSSLIFLLFSEARQTTHPKIT